MALGRATWATAILLAAVSTTLGFEAAAGAQFTLCKRGSAKLACVIDGDTFWLNNEKVRPEGYDAPEMGAPLCDRRAPAAEAARQRLLDLLNSGGALAIERHDQDQWGRTIAWVTIGGRSLAAIMIAEGLGRPYVSGEPPWCG